MKKTMNMKRILVSFLMIVSVLFFVATVSAAPLATITSVEVDGLNAGSNPAIVAGDMVTVRVEFNSLLNNSDVTLEVEIEGDKKDVKAETSAFDVEQGSEYVKSLKLEVPFDLQDELSGDVTLRVELSGDGDRTEMSYTLRVQRESFNADVKSVGVPQTVNAGDILPVDVVLKNAGYNDLDDLYVTASIPALGLERTAFFGDLVALECDDDDTALQNYGVDITRKCNEDDEDTLNRRLFLQVPFEAESGIYTLEVEVGNDDTTSSRTVQVVIDNAFSAGNFIVSGNELLIVNPTNDVVVYRLIPESSNALSVSLSENLVAVSPGASKTITTNAVSSLSGANTYSVNVFSADGKLVDTVTFASTTAQANQDVTSPIVVLTVILAIIFVVLLVVLIVLVGKKPEKADEFGESYY